MQQPTKREGAGAPARFEPEPGMIVAEKYRVERVLGEGGMGVVVAATHLGLEQPVAIKFLHADAMRDKDSVERFLREAKVAAMIRSDHVARVHDVGSLEGGIPYIVMEHLEGSDLGDLISLEGALPIDEACEVALQACAALAEVHAAGIVHRDLKPTNLFVTRRSDGSPDVKLLDFGISKISVSIEGAEDPALTATATIMGSPSYMSPDQLKSTKEVDARTDIWSLGAVLYEAVTGKPAFRGENVPQVCAMIASEEPARPSTLRAEVPPELEQAILGCLVKKADDRITLVALARTLAKLAPERAAGLLDRIEAKASPADARGRAPSPSGAETVRRHDAASPPSPRAAAVPTESTVLKRERRAGRGRRGVLLAAVAGVGVVAGAWYTGHWRQPDLRWRQQDLRQQVVGASGAVASAASAVSSAASAMASAVASSLPEPPASAAPAPSASDEAEEDTPGGGSAAAAGAAHAGGPSAHGAGKPSAPKPHPAAKPHHARPWHRTHTQ